MIMNSKVMIELFGYAGSVLVVVSMLMSSVMLLRLINTTGSVISGTYALIIGSYPLALMNICLVVINVYHLMRLRNKDKHYDMVEGSASEQNLKYLLQYYREDIAKYFPDFSLAQLTDTGRVFTVWCDHEVAGVLIGNQDGTEIDVALDYSTPVYRDCSVGKYLYEKLPQFGITGLTSPGCSPAHDSYLIKMGFEKTREGNYHKKLK